MVVGVDVELEMGPKLVVAIVVVSLDDGVLESAVHPFDLPVGPRVARLCQSVFGAILAADPVEQVHAVACCRA